MTTNNTNQLQHNTPNPNSSLLDDLETAAFDAKAKRNKKRRQRKAPTPTHPNASPADSALDTKLATTARAKRNRFLKRAAIPASAIALIAATTTLYINFRPTSVPDFMYDPFDDVLQFALLETDFNKLPLDQRIALIKDLIERLKNLSSTDSALMAAFAATIEDKMRRQLEQNVKQLGNDIIESFASNYESVPPHLAGQYLDESLLDIMSFFEDLAGANIGLPQDPQERLNALKRQAQRDERIARERAPTGANARNVGNFIEFLQRDLHETSSPVTRARNTRYLTHLSRHLRGRDPSTGERLPDNEPPTPQPTPPPR